MRWAGKTALIGLSVVLKLGKSTVSRYANSQCGRQMQRRCKEVREAHLWQHQPCARPQGAFGARGNPDRARRPVHRHLLGVECPASEGVHARGKDLGGRLLLRRGNATEARGGARDHEVLSSARIKCTYTETTPKRTARSARGAEKRRAQTVRHLPRERRRSPCSSSAALIEGETEVTVLKQRFANCAR